MTEEEKQVFANAEAFANWTYSGATLYYKDCDLAPEVAAQFTPGRILRNGYFLDVSWMGGGIHFNTRFLIASSKAAKLYEVNPDNEKYGHCCINNDSYFKVLDVYTIGNKTQIFLLHIPATGVRYFRQVVSNIDQQLIEKARKSFDDKIGMEPIPALLERFWVERTNFPVGMDGYNRLFPLTPTATLDDHPNAAMAKSLYNAIRNLTGDTTDINVPPAAEAPPEAPAKSGFWRRLFGK